MTPRCPIVGKRRPGDQRDNDQRDGTKHESAKGYVDRENDRSPSLINQNEQPQIAPRAKKDTFQGIVIPCAVLMPILFRPVDTSSTHFD